MREECHFPQLKEVALTLRNVATQDLRQEHVTEGSERVLGQKRKGAKKEHIS